jgi:hypothetical protein
MKIGLIIPVGRTDKYGYQYKDFTNLILDTHEKFADHIVAVSSSRHINKELFKNHPKIELISNEKTWFKLINGEEIFSLEVLYNNLNLGKKLVQKEGCDVACVITINAYIPESSINNLKKRFQKMLNKNTHYTTSFRRFMCGNLLFNASRKDSSVLNLAMQNPWEYAVDSITNKETGEIVIVQSKNFKRYNKHAFIDVPWEMTTKDAKEKFEFVNQEYERIRHEKLNKTYDSNNLNNLKFNKKKWFEYYIQKINFFTLSNEELDDVGKCILKLRKESFVSNILEKNYEKKSFLKRVFTFLKNII